MENFNPSLLQSPYQRQEHRQIDPLAPNFSGIEGAVEWGKTITNYLNHETATGNPRQAVVFLGGLPGSGKFINGGQFLRMALRDVPNLQVGYISFAQILDHCRKEKIIKSAFGTMTPPEEQEKASEEMAKLIIKFLKQKSGKPTLVVVESPLVAFRGRGIEEDKLARDQGGSTVFKVQSYASEPDTGREIGIFMGLFIASRRIQQAALSLRRELRKIQNPEEANQLLKSYSILPDREFNSIEDIEKFMRSYGSPDAIITTKKIVEKLIKEYKKGEEIKLNDYKEYYDMLMREVYGILTDHLFIGYNTRRRITPEGDAALSLQKFIEEHSILGN